MRKRTTLRDIAKLAKVSHVAVSLALRKHPSIPKSTRERIEKIAKKLKYAPDPNLSALVVYRHNILTQSEKYKATIAWINSHRHPEDLYGGKDKSKLEFGLYYLGAEERCKELGYQLEEFCLADLDMRYERLSKILYARGIQGILISPPERYRCHISSHEFDWSRFSAITFGYRLHSPQLHLVTNAQFRSARLAVRKLRSLGYRRIGYTTNHIFEERTDGNFMGGFLLEQSRFPEEERIPVFFQRSRDYIQEFRVWYKKHKPDAIFDINNCGYEALSTHERKKCGVALHALPEIPDGFAGIHQNGRLVGRAAVDELVALIHANERGAPATPRRILIEGRWVDGASAPRVNQKTK